MRRKFQKALNSFLSHFGLLITRTDKKIDDVAFQQVYDPSSSFMKNHCLQTLLIKELAEISQDFFLDRLAQISNSNFDFNSEVQRFWEVYAYRPLGYNTGGSGFHNAFWIYLFARILNPSLIVESGVWKGHTSWLLEQACPKATIHAFDINLGNLEYKTSRIRFHEKDWLEYKFENVDAQKSLVFFDCHVNHAQRLFEAYKKGFSHLLFDDNPPIHKLYTYGLPGFPTANMIYSGVHINSSYVSWYWLGKEKKYSLNKKEIDEAKKLIKMHEVFPDVGGPTRYGGFSYLTYVRI